VCSGWEVVQEVCSPMLIIDIIHSNDSPKLKMSAFSVHFPAVNTSGAAHANVPAERQARLHDTYTNGRPARNGHQAPSSGY
jgi:hypothetical protein